MLATARCQSLKFQKSIFVGFDEGKLENILNFSLAVFNTNNGPSMTLSQQCSDFYN